MSDVVEAGRGNNRIDEDEEPAEAENEEYMMVDDNDNYNKKGKETENEVEEIEDEKETVTSDDDEDLPDLPEADQDLKQTKDEDADADDELPDMPEADEDLPDVLPDLPELNDEGEEIPAMNGDATQDLDENKKKKKRSEGGKGKKKRKKGEWEKENKKATFLRDELKGPRIRSFDASKMKNKFDKPKAPQQVSNDCRMCGKQVFQMEKIVAEKASWHKNCFRCKECNKQLTLETYSSHEGNLYCKPHFKELFRPKAVIEDPDTARKERLLRRPKMIILESKPVPLPEDVVRSTSKPDYGLEELQTLNVKQKFSLFENANKDDSEVKLESAAVRRSNSLMTRAARFLKAEEDEYGVENSELGEYEDEEEEEEDEEVEEGKEAEEGAEPSFLKTRKRKGRPMSIAGMGDLKSAWEQKQRRENMVYQRKQELAKFRQMLCAGKNFSLKEKFESGVFDNEDEEKPREALKFEGIKDSKSIKERFEKGEAFDEEGNKLYSEEKQEVEEVFKDAETASRARNIFRQIDSKAAEGGGGGIPVLRSQSFANCNKEHRLSQDVSSPPATADIVRARDELDDFHVKTTDLASRFMFFATYEDRQKEEKDKKRKVFRFTPPPEEGSSKVEEVARPIIAKALRPQSCMAINCAVCKLRGMDYDDTNSNIVKSTDSTEDEVDCRNTRNILNMFKKMELKAGQDDQPDGPKPLKSFTPPPEGEEYDSEDDYSDEEYSEEDEEDAETEETEKYTTKYKDEFLEMANSSQSAKKAANLRAKFEKWETEVERQNEINNRPKENDDEECMPSLDTARNLRAMFENKAQEATKPSQRPPTKVNRFV